MDLVYAVVTINQSQPPFIFINTANKFYLHYLNNQNTGAKLNE